MWLCSDATPAQHVGDDPAPFGQKVVHFGPFQDTSTRSRAYETPAGPPCDSAQTPHRRSTSVTIQQGSISNVYTLVLSRLHRRGLEHTRLLPALHVALLRRHTGTARR